MMGYYSYIYTSVLCLPRHRGDEWKWKKKRVYALLYLSLSMVIQRSLTLPKLYHYIYEFGSLQFYCQRKKEIYVFPLGAETVKHQEQSAILYFNRQGVLCIYTEYIVMSTQRDIKLAQYGEMCDVVSQGFKTVHYPLSFRRQSSKWSSETPLQSI